VPIQGHDFEEPWAKEAGASMPLVNAVARQLFCHVVFMRPHDVVEMGHEAGQLQIRSQRQGDNGAKVPFEVLQRQRTMPQGFAGDGAVMHTGTADTGALLDDQDTLSGLGTLNGGFLARRTTADNDNVIVRGWHQDIPLMTQSTLSRLANNVATSSG
jgi:hypothetical protein